MEDYIWELEYECPNRAECRDRTPDTHLPTRPNETYFRYTTPNIIEVLKVNDELKELRRIETPSSRTWRAFRGPWKTTKSASTPT